MNLRFEKLHVAEPRHDFVHGTLYRSSVPGGWLVCFFWSTSQAGGPSLVFYPDPQHLWDGGSLDSEGQEASVPRASVK
jgi:hypothetical protein